MEGPVGLAAPTAPSTTGPTPNWTLDAAYAYATARAIPPTDPDGDPTYNCPFSPCGKQFSKRFNLKAHLRVHTGDKPFLCSFPGCTRRFMWKSSLTSHQTGHSRKKAEMAKRNAMMQGKAFAAEGANLRLTGGQHYGYAEHMFQQRQQQQQQQLRERQMQMAHQQGASHTLSQRQAYGYSYPNGARPSNSYQQTRPPSLAQHPTAMYGNAPRQPMSQTPLSNPLPSGFQHQPSEAPQSISYITASEGRNASQPAHIRVSQAHQQQVQAHPAAGQHHGQQHAHSFAQTTTHGVPSSHAMQPAQGIPPLQGSTPQAQRAAGSQALPAQPILEQGRQRHHPQHQQHLVHAQAAHPQQIHSQPSQAHRVHSQAAVQSQHAYSQSLPPQPMHSQPVHSQPLPRMDAQVQHTSPPTDTQPQRLPPPQPQQLPPQPQQLPPQPQQLPPQPQQLPPQPQQLPPQPQQLSSQAQELSSQPQRGSSQVQHVPSQQSLPQSQPLPLPHGQRQPLQSPHHATHAPHQTGRPFTSSVASRQAPSNPQFLQARQKKPRHEQFVHGSTNVKSEMNMTPKEPQQTLQEQRQRLEKEAAELEEQKRLLREKENQNRELTRRLREQEQEEKQRREIEERQRRAVHPAQHSQDMEMTDSRQSPRPPAEQIQDSQMSYQKFEDHPQRFPARDGPTLPSPPPMLQQPPSQGHDVARLRKREHLATLPKSSQPALSPAPLGVASNSMLPSPTPSVGLTCSPSPSNAFSAQFLFPNHATSPTWATTPTVPQPPLSMTASSPKSQMDVQMTTVTSELRPGDISPAPSDVPISPGITSPVPPPMLPQVSTNGTRHRRGLSRSKPPLAGPSLSSGPSALLPPLANVAPANPPTHIDLGSLVEDEPSSSLAAVGSPHTELSPLPVASPIFGNGQTPTSPMQPFSPFSGVNSIPRGKPTAW